MSLAIGLLFQVMFCGGSQPCMMRGSGGGGDGSLPYELIFAGDSHTAGQPPGTNQYGPYVTGCLIGNCATTSGKYITTYYATGGFTCADVGTSYDAPIAAHKSALRIQTVVLFCGTNDLRTGDFLASTAYTRLQARVAAYRAAGYTRIVVATILPVTFAGYATQRALLNGSIIAGASDSTWVVADLAANTTIGEDGDNTNHTYYQGDDVHLTAAGQQIVAGIMATAIQAVGGG